MKISHSRTSYLLWPFRSDGEHPVIVSVSMIACGNRVRMRDSGKRRALPALFHMNPRTSHTRNSAHDTGTPISRKKKIHASHGLFFIHQFYQAQ